MTCPRHPAGDCPAIPEMCDDPACTCCVRPRAERELPADAGQRTSAAVDRLHHELGLPPVDWEAR